MSLYIGIYYIVNQEKTPKIPHVGHVERRMIFLCLVSKLYQLKYHMSLCVGYTYQAKEKKDIQYFMCGLC